MTLSIIIRNPDGVVLEKGNVTLATLPGASGEFGVMDGHMNFRSSLKKGVIKIDDMEIPINWGVAEITTFNSGFTSCMILI